MKNKDGKVMKNIKKKSENIIRKEFNWNGFVSNFNISNASEYLCMQFGFNQMDLMGGLESIAGWTGTLSNTNPLNIKYWISHSQLPSNVCGIK